MASSRWSCRDERAGRGQSWLTTRARAELERLAASARIDQLVLLVADYPQVREDIRVAFEHHSSWRDAAEFSLSVAGELVLSPGDDLVEGPLLASPAGLAKGHPHDALVQLGVGGPQVQRDYFWPYCRTSSSACAPHSALQQQV